MLLLILILLGLGVLWWMEKPLSVVSDMLSENEAKTVLDPQVFLTDTMTDEQALFLLGITDTDADGLPDTFELQYGFDPQKSDWNTGGEDTDGDGIDDVTESHLGTSSEQKDTDQDGISDYNDREYGKSDLS